VVGPDQALGGSASDPAGSAGDGGDGHGGNPCGWGQRRARPADMHTLPHRFRFSIPPG
jgi:hypothetical protein